MDKVKLQGYLPTPANINARMVYRELEKHFSIGIGCNMCTCYHRYGIMLTTGDYESFIGHLSYIVNAAREKPIEHFEQVLGRIEDAGLIEISMREPRLYEVVFTQLVPQEVLA